MMCYTDKHCLDCIDCLVGLWLPGIAVEDKIES